MTASTLPRLAEAATAARGGADLYRFSLGDRIPDAAFAKLDDGTFRITGIDLLKSGTFNGLSLLDEDLVAMAQRFTDLSDAGIFVPPFRLDHSWSVLSVVGYFDNVEAYDRVDETDSLRKTFLRGDVILTGSVDYKPSQLVDAIKRGALRSRSSELGYYVTNSGAEIPLAFYGCAFVDIPAVEGLAPVTLSARRPEPHSITNLSTTPEGLPTMDPKKLARLKALRAKLSAEPLGTQDDGEAEELTELEGEAQAAGVTDADVEAAADEEPTPDPVDPPAEPAPGPGDDPAPVAPEPGTDPVPAEPVTPAPSPADDPAAVELAELRAQVATLRQAETERQLATFSASGVIVEANREAATALLGHDDEGVRRAAGTLLGGITPSIKLGRRQGSTTSTDPAAGSQVIELGMTSDEVGALWRDLTSAERKLRQPELDAWEADRKVRDS